MWPHRFLDVQESTVSKICRVMLATEAPIFSTNLCLFLDVSNLALLSHAIGTFRCRLGQKGVVRRQGSLTPRVFVS